MHLLTARLDEVSPPELPTSTAFTRICAVDELIHRRARRHDESGGQPVRSGGWQLLERVPWFSDRGADVKFDVILTNPPFQDSVNRKKTPHKLWIDFTLAVFDRLLVQGGSLLQVSPASISSPSNVVLSLMAENQTKVLRFDTARHFPEVSSTFCDYWIRKEANESTLTTVLVGGQTFLMELDKTVEYLPNDLSPLAVSIHRKVMFADRPPLQVEWDYVTCHNIRRYDADPSLVEEFLPTHPNPVFHTNRKTWWSKTRQSWADAKKVMWTRSGYTKPFYDDGTLGGTDMVYFVRVDSAAQGRALEANLNSALLRYIYQTARWSGFGNERVFDGLPALPLERAVPDDELFALFDLTDEEALYVRQSLAPRSGKTR